MFFKNYTCFTQKCCCDMCALVMFFERPMSLHITSLKLNDWKIKGGLLKCFDCLIIWLFFLSIHQFVNHSWFSAGCNFAMRVSQAVGFTSSQCHANTIHAKPPYVSKFTIEYLHTVQMEINEDQIWSFKNWMVGRFQNITDVPCLTFVIIKNGTSTIKNEEFRRSN